MDLIRSRKYNVFVYEKEFAVYKGEEILFIGTWDDVINALNITEKTMYYYLSNSYRKRFKSKKPSKRLVIMPLDDEDE